MIPVLPQKDPDPTARATKLSKAAASYGYRYDRFSEVAMCESLPLSQAPTPPWVARAAQLVLHILHNAAQVYEKFEDRRPPESPASRFKRFLSTDVKDIPRIVHDEVLLGENEAGHLKEVVVSIKNEGIGWAFEQILNKVIYGEVQGHARSLDEFAQLFCSIELPAVAGSYSEDAVFAHMRLAGPNPVMIQRLRHLDRRFPVTETQFQAVMGGEDSLEAALAEGRLYIEDLTALHGAEAGSFPDGQKVLPAPLALFAVPRAGSPSSDLVPVAIQCAPDPGPDNPILTPADGMAWTQAKTALTVADGNVHQAVSHLAHTHLVMEAMVLGARRTLAATHPILCLLEPHFEGTLAINNSADHVLCRPEGGVDAVLSGSIETSRNLAAASVTSYDFNQAMLRPALAARGVEATDALPGYPYRDDALLLRDALHGWVTDYVAIYYAADGDVVGDTELQALAREVSAPDGGRIGGFGDPAAGGEPAIHTRAYLADAITHIIFTGSVQHAAVNFPQNEMMAFVPNYPLSSYSGPATSAATATEASYLQMLPPLDMALYQLEWGYLLGTLRHTQLGRYHALDPLRTSYFKDGRVKEPLARFQARLEEVESTIQGRNQKRQEYSFLRPSLVPQSLNI